MTPTNILYEIESLAQEARWLIPELSTSSDAQDKYDYTLLKIKNLIVQIT